MSASDLDDVPKLTVDILRFFFKVEFLEVKKSKTPKIKKTPPGNILKNVPTHFHEARMSGSDLNDVPKLTVDISR